MHSSSRRHKSANRGDLGESSDDTTIDRYQKIADDAHNRGTDSCPKRLRERRHDRRSSAGLVIISTGIALGKADCSSGREVRQCKHCLTFLGPRPILHSQLSHRGAISMRRNLFESNSVSVLILGGIWIGVCGCGAESARESVVNHRNNFAARSPASSVSAVSPPDTQQYKSVPRRASRERGDAGVQRRCCTARQ